MIWQPIETAPRDGTPILAFWRHGGDKTRCSVIRWHKDEWWTFASPGLHNLCAHTDTEPTHWMPLPPPPQE